MPTLAELRAQTGPRPLPKARVTVTLVEGQHLLTKQQQIRDRLYDLLAQQERDESDEAAESKKRARKQGAVPKAPPIQEQIEAAQVEYAEAGDQIAEFQADVDLTGLEGGAWQRYKDDHPPRVDNKADETIASGLLNSSELFADLGRFVTAWEGEALADGDWGGWLAERICYADRKGLVTEVVEMHEVHLRRAPKAPSPSSSTEPSASD